MKILIIHATAGAGHSKAAEAIFNGIKKHTTHDVRCVDTLDYTSPFYKALYKKTYTILISHFSLLWAFFFWVADIPFLLPVIQALRRFFNGLSARALEKFLENEKFDYIFTTHFFSNEVVSSLKEKNKISAKLICVITDFDVHSIWLAKNVDCYAVACELTKKKLEHFGVPAEKIAVTGIPTDEKFLAPKDQKELRIKLGLDVDLFTVLIATGSFGIGPIGEIVGYLKDIQCVVICGHNQKLTKKLSAIKTGKVKILGFVNNMNEYMAASDALITKPGGLSISEALVVGLPLVFFSAIPGQETNNVKALRAFGVGVSGLKTFEIAQEIQTLKASPDYLEAAKEKIKKIARSNSVCDIIKLVS
ncbi:MAG: glycosyltransferase [Candidatus Omnitrophica bacterium]|nr:glycosyltransferase [Candidatus Omnitrophota bacterium]